MSIEVDQLDWGPNLVVETLRSTTLMKALVRQPEAVVLTSAQEAWCLTMQSYLQALHGPALAAGPKAAIQEALLRIYRTPPTLTMQDEALQIVGEPVLGVQQLWGVLTANVESNLMQAVTWLQLYLWAAECGLQIRLQDHKGDELRISLHTASDSAQTVDAQWLEDLFDQFSA